jgi:hypothetical protein
MVVKEPRIAENKQMALFQRVCVFCRIAPDVVRQRYHGRARLNLEGAAAKMHRKDSKSLFQM